MKNRNSFLFYFTFTPFTVCALFVSVYISRRYNLTVHLTFTSLHSRESEKAGNISSYFCNASYKRKMKKGKWMRAPERTAVLFESGLVLYLSIKHVHTEVAESSFEEIILRTVLQQIAVHCMGCNLKKGHKCI